MEFAYRARDQRGQLVTGRMEAENIKGVEHVISRQGLIPLQVKESSQSVFQLPRWQDLLVRVTLEDLIVFTRQFYTLFKSGMNMGAILQTLLRQSNNKHLKEAVRGIHSDVSAGSSLGVAFGKHSKIFPQIYASLIAAGEKAGILEEVLKHMATLLEKEHTLKSGIKSATLYPKIVMGVMAISTYILMTVVVPKFAKFYAHYGASLPLPTRMMMGMSSFVTDYWYIVFGVALIGFFLFRRFARTPRGRLWLGELKFKLPVFGNLEMKVVNARFCHLLAALYRSGLSMPKSLEIVSATIENGAFVQDVKLVASDIGRGETLSEAMVHCRHFSPILVEAIAIGEKSGSLDEMLFGIGDHYDVEVEHTLKNLTTLLEPIMLVLIFGMVTLMALAIFLPIWNMSNLPNR